MPETIRVDLDAPLSGRHILVDPEQLTFGLLEDLQSERASIILDTLASCITGSDLPHGSDRQGLRRLKPAEMKAVMQGVGTAFAVPKS